MSCEEVQQCGSILCLDVPPGTEFGIDYQVFETGTKFKGVKLLRPGVHFVYYSARNVNYQADSAPRTGFFLVLHSGEVAVWRWNPSTEDFYNVEEISKEDKERFAEGECVLDTHNKHFLNI